MCLMLGKAALEQTWRSLYIADNLLLSIKADDQNPALQSHCPCKSHGLCVKELFRVVRSRRAWKQGRLRASPAALSVQLVGVNSVGRGE